MDATLLDKVAAYTQQFVNAAIPVAKKAYEVGLLTLQIDAFATLFLGFTLVMTTVLLFTWSIRYMKGAQEKADKINEKRTYEKFDRYDCSCFDNIGYFLFNASAVIPGIIGMVYLTQVWTWVKLFAPDLWLAHAAVQKLVGG